MTIKAVALAAALVLVAGWRPAMAQLAPATTDAPAVTPICTDRPTKANSPCTVPAGSVQIETDVINWTRLGAPGVQTDTVLYTNPTVKYGLGNATDIELNIAPYETIRTRAGGVVDIEGGVGDLYLRVKQLLTAPSSKVQVALIPYVKAPTARLGVGNGRVEGGVIAPVAFTLPQGVTITAQPEVDVLADATRGGRHAQLVGIVNFAKSIGKATLYAELWSAQNYDPARTVRQYSADVMAACLIAPTVQIDAGGSFGLNRLTPAAQLFVGLSTRF